MTFASKMDSLDLILHTLKEHEKTLDQLTMRLELMLEGKAPLDERVSEWFPKEKTMLDDWR